ncbi:MAG: aldo/keto reductase [Clostridia bacterium]|nr:aldo/keto reductase [Clostridia bacterium]
MNKFFSEAKRNFGFGCMRLPMRDGEVDKEEFSKMVDAFIDAGFNYFDTAHGYLGGKSETAIRDCLSSRHDRSEFLLTNKLSSNFFEKTEDIRPLFESQLRACGVDYFDFYLMHAQDSIKYEKYTRLHAYETAYKFKEEGLIRHFGLSFHDKADLLDRILTEHPEVEVVQIQFNYIDYDDAAVQSRLCYDVCVKHNKPVIVMEPVKGGSLVNLPDGAKKILDDLGGGSPASYAIRFAASFDNIFMVLSGMGNMDMMNENVGFMKDFVPLDDRELDALSRVREEMGRLHLIPCTACRYCMEKCPLGISIPDLFACMNAKTAFSGWNADYYYENVHTSAGRRASDCLKCGACESICPQHLEIRDLLEKVAATFEK